MRLARYFSATAATATGLILIGMSILVAAVTLVESAGDFSKADAGLGAVLRLAVYSAIHHGYQILPIACFLGALVSGTLLARRGELLAAQAAGVSVMRVAVAFFSVVLLAAFGGAACGELLVPRALAGVDQVQREDLRHTTALSRFYNRQLQWFRAGDLMLYLPTVERETQSFLAPVVYRFEQGLISEVFEADRLRHDEVGWWLENARVNSVGSAEIEHFSVVRLALTVTPRDLIDVTGDPRQMTSGELGALIERRTRAGFDTTSHRIELHNRFALPLSAVWMFFLVVPWALHPDRRRSMAVTLGGGVVLIAALLAMIQLFRLLALGHTIPIAIGAWGPGIVALAMLPVSLALYNRYRVHGSLL